jgi:phospholipase/carboxylesterase
VIVRHVDRPAAGDAAGALVFFHGYGGKPEESLGFLDRIDPERRFDGYLPEAPYLDAGGSRSWFERTVAKPPGKQLRPIADWLDRLPHRPAETVIGGWSQGANLAYAIALGPGRPRPAGVIALGGGFRDELQPDLEQPLPPIAIAHGRADPIVPVEVVRQARQALERAGAAVVYCETETGHTIDEAAISELRAFLAKLP